MQSLCGFTILILSTCLLTWGQSTTTPAGQPGPPTAYRLDPVSDENAAYPSEARKKRVEGELTAIFLISEAGSVVAVNVSRADPLLGQAVEAAVRKWKFVPVTKDDKAIEVLGRAKFRFSLKDQAEEANGVPGEIGAATDVPKKIRVSQGVVQAMIRKKVDPIYPFEARQKGIQGVVLLTVIIGRDGSIVDLRPVSGPPELVPAASEAVKQWRYQPYLFMGTAIEVETQIQVSFQR